MERHSPATAEMTWSRSPACPVFPLCQSAYFPQCAQQGACKICPPGHRDLSPLAPCSSSVLGISLECSNSKEAFTPKALKVILFYRLYLEWKPCLFLKIFFFSWRKLALPNVVLVSAIQWESAITVHSSPSSWASLPPLPSGWSQNARPGSLCYIKPQSWMTRPCSTFLCWTDTNFPRPYQA